MNNTNTYVRDGLGSEEDKINTLKTDGSYLKYIKNPTEEMKKIAVQQNGYAIKFISNPSNELIEIAIRQQPSNSMYIENPTKEQIELMISIDPMSIRYIRSGVTRKHWTTATKANPILIRYIPRQFITKTLAEEVGCKDFTMIPHIPNRILDMKLVKSFVQANGYALQFIDEEFLVDEIKIVAINQDYHAAKFVKSFDDIKKLMPLIHENGKILDYLDINVLRQVCKRYREIYIDE